MGSGRALKKCAYMTERFSWDLNRKRELCSKYLVRIVYTFVRPYDAPYFGGPLREYKSIYELHGA